MSKNNVALLSETEIDAVSGGGSFNYNYGTITQVNAVGAGLVVDQSNQAVQVQGNKSFMFIFAAMKSYQ